MWTDENRQRYNRDKLRYPSDLTDQEWSLVQQMIPPAKRGGRPREVEVRQILNGILYVLRTRMSVALRPQGPIAEKHAARLFPALGL